MLYAIWGPFIAGALLAVAYRVSQEGIFLKNSR